MAAVAVTSPAPAPASRILPVPFRDSKEPFQLIAQGAEGVVYRTNFLPSASSPSTSTSKASHQNSSNGSESEGTEGAKSPGNAALKIRFPKPWRHPTLDRRLTRQRILAEARVLVKLARELRAPQEEGGALGGGAVPGVLGMSWEEGWMATEWIEGCTVKTGIRTWEARQGAGAGSGAATTITTIRAAETELRAVRTLLGRVGTVVGRLHAAGVVHGDLTTSNMMIRGCACSCSSDPPSTSTSTCSTSAAPVEQDTRRNADLEGQIVLLDFGLAQQSISEEDRAVDLYVLERAFGSTHPKVMEGRYSGEKDGAMFEQVLQAYAAAMGKSGRVVLRRLEDVRMRGRKKSMLG